jgi:hypothetical protein
VTRLVLDQLAVLKLVTGRLDAAGIPYMITGSIALGHYAQPRFTRDIDLVVELRPDDAERIAALFQGDFETDAASIRAAIARESMFNLIHVEAIVKIGFVVRKSSAYRLEEFRRRRTVMVDEQPVWMVTPEDLVLSKLAWAGESRSELQLRDVRHILAAQPGLDWSYLDHWSDSLGVGRLLQEVRS